MVTQDPEDLEQALLIPLKTNIDRKLKALSFRIVVEEDAERKRPRLVWTGERDVSAKDALEPERKEPVTKKETIEKWLIAKFRERPARPSADLCAAPQGRARLRRGFHVRGGQEGPLHRRPQEWEVLGKLRHRGLDLLEPMRTDFTELAWKMSREDLIPRRVVACNAVSESGASR